MRWMLRTYLMISLSLTLAGPGLMAQDQRLQPRPESSPFEKRFHWGISYNNYWSTITGDHQPREYFYKPSLGFNIRAEYYFLDFLGAGIGAGYQQRGTGLLNHDIDQSANNPDSTFRERLRFNTIEIPISILLRTPQDIIKGIRLSGSLGVVPMFNTGTEHVFLSIEDGHHQVSDVSSNYYKNDLAYQFTFGAEIKSSASQLLQVHAVYTKGTKNVYNTGPDGKSETIGFRISILF